MGRISQVLRFALAALLCWGLLGDLEAGAAPPASGRQAAEQARVVRLRQLVLTLAQLEVVTEQSLIDTLGGRVGRPVQVTPYRREWPLLPSDLIAEGVIVQAGTDLTYVTVKPAPALNLSFEDLAAMLSNLPYMLRERSGHVGVDSVATRIYAIDHSFRGKGGILEVQIPTTLPDDTVDREARAIREGYEVAMGGKFGPVRVAAISFRTPGELGWPDWKKRTLREFRKLRQGSKKRVITKTAPDGSSNPQVRR